MVMRRFRTGCSQKVMKSGLSGNRRSGPSAFRYLYLVFAILLGVSPGVPANADHPFGFMETRSQSPLQQLRCGPLHHVPWVLPAKNNSLSIRHNWKNLWLYRDDICLIDAEVQEVVTRLRIGLGAGFEIAGELPVRFVSGGMLDGMIEDFHNSFGLSNAGRDQFPRNNFIFMIHRGGDEDSWYYAGADQTGWNLGNATFALSTDIGRIISIEPRLVMTVGVKIPTGTRRFFGSQSLDLALSLSSGINFGSFHWYVSSAVSHYGDEEMIGISLRQWHLSTLVSLEYRRPDADHAWVAQILCESGVTEDNYPFSNATYEVMFGYKYRLWQSVVMEFSILENVLTFDNSPDFGLHTALTYSS